MPTSSEKYLKQTTVALQRELAVANEQLARLSQANLRIGAESCVLFALLQDAGVQFDGDLKIVVDSLTRFLVNATNDGDPFNAGHEYIERGLLAGLKREAELLEAEYSGEEADDEEADADVA